MIKKKKLRKIKVLWQFLFSNWFVVDKAVAKEKIFHFSFVPIVIDKIFGIKKVDFSFFFQFESFQITFYYSVWFIATLLEDPPSLLDVDTHEQKAQNLDQVDHKDKKQKNMNIFNQSVVFWSEKKMVGKSNFSFLIFFFFFFFDEIFLLWNELFFIK